MPQRNRVKETAGNMLIVVTGGTAAHYKLDQSPQSDKETATHQEHA
jgi:hypothetical protein